MSNIDPQHVRHVLGDFDDLISLCRTQQFSSDTPADKQLWATKEFEAIKAKADFINGFQLNRPRVDEPKKEKPTRQMKDFSVSTRREAYEVLEGLQERVDRYGHVSIDDLYVLSGMSGSYGDSMWGWSDISEAHVARKPSGYYIVLPRPVRLC